MISSGSHGVAGGTCPPPGIDPAGESDFAMTAADVRELIDHRTVDRQMRGES